MVFVIWLYKDKLIKQRKKQLGGACTTLVADGSVGE